MTSRDIENIAKRLDKDTQKKIDKEVDERLDILKNSDLDEEDMDKVANCLYVALVLEEYLNGQYELLEEEKEILIEEMEEMYDEYGELLTKAKLEEKLSKKKRMALELMRIRERLFDHKDRYSDVKGRITENRNNANETKKIYSKETIESLRREVELQKDRDRSIKNAASKGKVETVINEKGRNLNSLEDQTTKILNNVKTQLPDPYVDSLDNVNNLTNKGK